MTYVSLDQPLYTRLSIEEPADEVRQSSRNPKRYLEFLEAAFLIKIVHRIDHNARRFRRANHFKVYVTTPALRCALFGPVAEDSEPRRDDRAEAAGRDQEQVFGVRQCSIFLVAAVPNHSALAHLGPFAAPDTSPLVQPPAHVRAREALGRQIFAKLAGHDDRVVPRPDRVLAHVGPNFRRERFEDLLRIGRPFVHDLARGARCHDSDGRCAFRNPACGGQRLPRRALLVFGHAEAELAGVPEGRSVDSAEAHVEQLMRQRRIARPITAVARSLLPSALNVPSIPSARRTSPLTTMKMARRVGQDANRPFPWVVSDFGLVDAIESGLVNIPQLAVRDTSGSPIPGYFNIWRWILPRLTPAERGGRRGRVKPEAVLKYAHVPVAMLGGLWEVLRREWSEREDEPRPPVFIIVCNDTALAKVVYRWLAEDEAPVGIPPARLDGLRNSQDALRTIRVDSKVVRESDDGGAKSDADRWMRLTLDTVGKTDWPWDTQRRPIYPDGFEALAKKLERPLHPPGRDVRCIVSVGMLTEGWDCNTVTHIVGLRPFMSQLLCEQVVGRGLRRSSYAVGDDGKFGEEVAKIFGVPFEVVPLKENPAGNESRPPRRSGRSTRFRTGPNSRSGSPESSATCNGFGIA